MDPAYFAKTMGVAANVIFPPMERDIYWQCFAGHKHLIMLPQHHGSARKRPAVKMWFGYQSLSEEREDPVCYSQHLFKRLRALCGNTGSLTREQ